MSANLERAITLLREEVQTGSVPVVVLLQKALAVGLNRDYLKNAKRALGIVAIRDRDPKTARTIRWRWSLPMHTPPPRPPVIPHRWGLYNYHTEGRYYFKRAEAGTFKELQKQLDLDPPLWVLLVTDAALVLPLRIPADAVPALGMRWKRLEDLPPSKVGNAKP